jgi:hypothetical protein
MADTKISAETSAAALDGTEMFPAVQAAGNVKVTAAQLKTFAQQTATSTQAGTTYTAAIGDANTDVSFTNASAVTFTIPPNSSVAYPVNTVIGALQTGAGTVSFAAGAGVTINTPSGLALAGQYAYVAAKKTATDTWILTGDLAGGGSGTTTNAVTFAASGGAAAGTTFNGSAAKTIDYHTVGALPEIGSLPTGHFVVPDGHSSGGTVVAMATGTMVAVPFTFRRTMAVTSLAFQINTLAAAGNVQLAIYDSHSTLGFPNGAPIWSSASQSTAATGVFTIGSLSFTLNPNHLYWLVANSDNSTVQFNTTVITNPGVSVAAQLFGDTAANALSTSAIRGWQLAQTFGTWPTTTGAEAWAVSSNQRAPLVAFSK